jgi:large subunit ribosomal protein L4
MKSVVYNFKGEKIGEIEVPDEIFNLKVNESLIHQVLRWQLMNSYFPFAHTKTRAEVRGGGRKPWVQKGTGRARHGSIRSPIWVKGGITFGPRNEINRKLKINKKMKRKAILMVIASKFKENKLIIIDDIEGEISKTKEFDKFFSYFLKPTKTSKKKETALLVIPENNDKIFKGVRNLPYADTIEARNLNILSLLNHKYLFLLKDSIDVIKKIFTKNLNLKVSNLV